MTTSLASRQLTRALETANIVDRARIGDSMQKRQTGAPPKEAVGDSNPVPKPGNLNNLGDSAPLQGAANGAMSPFAKRAASSDELSLSTPFEKRSPLAVAHPYELNEISHLLATRGRADGTIEYF
ncbi:hypothetical protein JCM3766R1_004486 [Sporobolomyces carnicolor]